MSNNESFIDEVTEEVRRDKLFGYVRRYGWIAILSILALVGTTAWLEYTKAKAAAEAEAAGDAIIAALRSDDPVERSEALAALPPSPVVALLHASEQQLSGNADASVAALNALANDATAPQIYRDIAAFKALLTEAESLEPAALKEKLAPLAVPGHPLRLLALEQDALADVRAGDIDAALATLANIREDASVSRSLRERAEGLIVALGGTLPETPSN